MRKRCAARRRSSAGHRTGPGGVWPLVLAAGVAVVLARAADAQTRPPEPDATLGGEYRITQWTTADGLPQSSVTDIVILRSGEMWVSTFGGLARFDGVAFRVLNLGSTYDLPSNRIVALARQEPDSFLFLSQQGHLGRVDRAYPTLLLEPPEATADFIDLDVDPSGRILARDVLGGVWATDGRHSWQLLYPGGAPRTRARDVEIDEEGQAWILSIDSLAHATAGSSRGLPIVDGRALGRRPGGGLWLATGGSLGQFVGDHLETVTIRPDLAAPARIIEAADEDTVWIGSPGSVSLLARQADGSWRRRLVPLSISAGDRVTSLHSDASGALWVGTDGRGLFRVLRMPIDRLDLGAGFRAIAAVASDGRHGLWIAAGCLAMFHVDAQGTRRRLGVTEFSRDSPATVCGASVASGPGEDTWVRVGSSLSRIAGATGQVDILSAALPNEEGPILSRGDGSLWVVSRGGRVQTVTHSGEVTSERTLEANLFSASLGPDGALWIGGDGEVFRLAGGDTERFGALEGVPRGIVRDLVAESDGTTWIASYGGGLGRLRNGRVDRLTVSHGLPDDSVSRILADRHGRLWILTNHGIAVVDRHRLDAVADGTSTTFLPVVLGTERGVPEANFGSPAGFADSRGRFWFGTIDGVVAVDSARFPSDTAPLPVRIDEVRADDHPVPMSDVVTIPPLTTRLRVDFTSFELHYPEQVRFRYRLEGVDADWIPVDTDRHLNWTQLGPGRFRLLIEARNVDGLWSSEPTVLELDILPAWWQTTAFRLVAGLSLLLIGAVALRLRIQSIERGHAARLRVLEEQRLAEDRMGRMRAQLEHVSRAALAGELAASIAHEVGQPIGAIVNNAEAGRRRLSAYVDRPDELEHLLSDIVTDAMRVSEVVKGLRGFLQPRGPEAAQVDLSAVVREALPLVRRELEKNHVTVTVTLTEAPAYVEGLRVQLSQIVVNLVVNACEALADVVGLRRLDIATATRADRVELTVCDNGPGLAADVAARIFDPFVTTKSGGLGVGLAVCRSIAERHGGRLTAEPLPTGGLCMRLSLPAAPPMEPQP